MLTSSVGGPDGMVLAESYVYVMWPLIQFGINVNVLIESDKMTVLLNQRIYLIYRIRTCARRMMKTEGRIQGTIRNYPCNNFNIFTPNHKRTS